MRSLILACTIALLSASVDAVVDNGKTGSDITEDVLTLRDPFKMPAVTAIRREVLTELQQFQVHEYKLVGVMTGPKEMKAMLLAPNGKAYFVTQNEKIGTRKGIVRKITTDKVVVHERVVNVLGREEDVVSEIPLIGESALQAEGVDEQNQEGL